MLQVVELNRKAFGKPPHDIPDAASDRETRPESLFFFDFGQPSSASAGCQPPFASR